MYRIISTENLKDDGVYIYNDEGDWKKVYMFLHGTKESLQSRNTILQNDELLYCNDIKSEKRYKQGDGKSLISELPFIRLKDISLFSVYTCDGRNYSFYIKGDQ